MTTIYGALVGEAFGLSIDQIRRLTTAQQWEIYIRPRLPKEEQDPASALELWTKVYFMSKAAGQTEAICQANADDAAHRWTEARQKKGK